MRKGMRLRIRSLLVIIAICALVSKAHVTCEQRWRHEMKHAEWEARFHYRLKRWPAIVRTEVYFRDGGLFVLVQDEGHYTTLMQVNRFMGEVTVIYRVRTPD
jgi:hypothetical protein